MTSEPIPELYQGQLDPAGLLAYADDLAALEAAVHVNVKSAERAYVDEAQAWSVGAAFAALSAGSVRAVQLRYVHDAVHWTDTLFRSGDGYRLVRMRALV